MGSKQNRSQRWKPLLAIPLSMLLLASFAQLSFATEDFKSFDGDDFVDVPNSLDLQLAKFAAEVRFRINEEPVERGYLVSKGAAWGGNVLLDQNYALFVTPNMRVVGGFKALDGSYNYLYSSAVSQDVWHIAKLVYDGNTLRLLVDGAVVASAYVVKAADSQAIGALRIGANSNGPADKFYVGDIDYVKIVDRSTFQNAYYRNFKDSVGSTYSDCADVPVSEFKGAVFRDPVLGTLENGGDVNAPWNHVSESMKYIKLNGMNVVRVPYYWEAYVHDPAAFLDELESIASAAEAHEICVVFANFHWYTTSYWDIEIIGNSDGRGFPSFVVKNFPVKNSDYDATAAPFWNAFLSNSIVIDGKNVWDVQADFIKKVIRQVDQYDSVAGFEIMNEPHLFDKAQYDKLGNYHTYLAKEMREVTDKKIFFNREITRGIPREPSLEYKIVPRGVSGLVYEPHLYAVPLPGSNAEKQLSNFDTWSKEWGVEILIGEWAADTQTDTDLFATAFKERGFGWTYYAWKPTTDRGLGSSLYQSDSTPPTIYLQYLANALEII